MRSLLTSRTCLGNPSEHAWPSPLPGSDEYRTQRQDHVRARLELIGSRCWTGGGVSLRRQMPDGILVTFYCVDVDTGDEWAAFSNASGAGARAANAGRFPQRRDLRSRDDRDGKTRRCWMTGCRCRTRSLTRARAWSAGCSARTCSSCIATMGLPSACPGSFFLDYSSLGDLRFSLDYRGPSDSFHPGVL